MDTRRQEVIDYVVHKYGADKVAQIMTFGTLGARVSIRDTGAVLEIDPKLVDKVAKLIPQEVGMNIEKAFTSSPEFAELYKNDSQVKKLVDHAKMIEGLIRQTGVHAAGILISDKPLVEFGALMEQEDSDIPVFMGDMKAVDFFKLIKFDFLGLRTLTVIDDAVKLIKNQLDVDIDIDNVDIDDRKVFELISTGNTHGVFQLEQGGMQKFMQELQPQSIEDIILGISMYRPGPMDKIPQLIENKKNPTSIYYQEDAKELLKPILSVTYGIICYQEQCMEIVKSLAGYDFGRADNIRRAMSKKQDSVMAYEREIFIYGAATCEKCNGKGKDETGEKCTHCNGTGEVVANEIEENLIIKGCIRNGISYETANSIYADMVDFARYAFNKSHATCYGIIGYQTAYLLKYYPVQYMTAYLNSIILNADKVRKYIGVCKKMGITINRPDINKCESLFTCDINSIYMGLTSLKYVGTGIQNAIEERKQYGEYKDLQDLLTRNSLSKREIESLIKSGALDSFGHKRSQMLERIEDFVNATKMDRQKKESGQFSLFDLTDDEEILSFNKIELPNIEEYSEMTKFKMEKEVSGFYLSGHPLNLPEYVELTKESNITTIDEFTEDDNRKKINLIGIVNIDEKDKEGFKYSPKTGNEYCIFSIEDKYSTIKILAFKDVVQKCKSIVFNGNIVNIKGTLSVSIETFVNEEGELIENKDVKIFLEDIFKVSDLKERKKVYIKITSDTQHKINQINSIINKNPGYDIIRFYNSETKKTMEHKKCVGCTPSFVDTLSRIVGDGNVVVK